MVDVTTNDVDVTTNDNHARFGLAMASAGIGMAIVSLDGRWVEVNPALCRLLGRPADALVGGLVQDIPHPDDALIPNQLLARLLSGQENAIEAEKRYLRPDGEAVEIRLNSALMRGPDGEPQYVISQLLDITAERRAQRALQGKNAELEQRINARTAELEMANLRLEAFASGVSHDLRAPLRAIDGFAAQLARSSQDALGAQAMQQLERIRSATGRMGVLIDSLLELARISRAQLRAAPVDVSLLVEWVMADLQDAQPGRNAELQLQPGLQVVGDERLLKAMLHQLLENAWRFSGSRRQVSIEVEGHRQAGGLALSIRDQGIGFDMAYAGKLFEPFQRLHGGEEGAGNGIGLTIAQQIAARHGGAIRAEASPQAGATFHVQLCDLDTTPVEA